MERTSPPRAHRVLQPAHNQTLASLIASHAGQVVSTTGDGFFAAFAEPNPALDCAVAIQRALDRNRRGHGFAPRVRIGIHLTEATRQVRTGGAGMSTSRPASPASR